MKEKQRTTIKSVRERKQKPISGPVYEPPEIITYTSEMILEEAGPALLCSGTPCGMDG